MADQTATDLDPPNFDPLVPRPLDLWTELPLSGQLVPEVGDIAKIFAAPDDPADWPGWRDALATWRTEARNRLDFDDAAYADPRRDWASRCYSVALLWLWDERLFDHDRHCFRVDEFLAATADHGGFDAVVLWHAYPVIGLDDRNQFDFYHAPGLAEVLTAFHDHGIKVFLDYNPWDTGTRRPNADDATELVRLATQLGADGIFLDTLKNADAGLMTALESADPPLVAEGESRVPNTSVDDHLLSWAQWFADSDAPGVMRAHWFERRHMMHSTRRWNRDHHQELQSSWMNGVGMLVWDTVFGVWVGWNERDKATLRHQLRVQRQLADVLIHGEWIPLTDLAAEAMAAGVYASRWRHGPLTLWTIINRAEQDFKGVVLDVASDSGDRLYDLVDGREIAGPREPLTVPAAGIGAVLAVDGPTPDWLPGLLADAAADEYASDHDFPAREVIRVEPGPSHDHQPSTDAVTIEPGERELIMSYRRRETGSYTGAPYVEEWKPLPPRLHDRRTETHRVDLTQVAVTAREVTEDEFAHFLTETGYRPVIANRFPIERSGDRPATMINLADARAYADWTGARLPTEWEWQVAAGLPGFTRAIPLVWNLTESEHSDGVTRFSMIKGGADYLATGSDWYVDGGPRPPEFSLKLLTLGLGLERSPQVGFRIAWDLP